MWFLVQRTKYNKPSDLSFLTQATNRSPVKHSMETACLHQRRYFIWCLWWSESIQYLSRHVHEQYSSYGSLSLAVSLLWPVESVGLKNTKQILLSVKHQHTDKLRQMKHQTNPQWSPHTSRPTTYPCPPRDTNISWKGNCRWRSFSITSTHLGSPAWLSSSWPNTWRRFYYTVKALWPFKLRFRKKLFYKFQWSQDYF